jgi:hypothetical protein
MKHTNFSLWQENLYTHEYNEQMMEGKCLKDIQFAMIYLFPIKSYILKLQNEQPKATFHDQVTNLRKNVATQNQPRQPNLEY